MKGLVILVIIFIAVSAGLYYFFFLKPIPAGRNGLPESIGGPAGLDAGQNLPQSNPFEETKTNPFEGVYKNPFE